MAITRSNFDKFRLPILLLIILIAPMIFGELISYDIKAFCYSISLVMKGILVTLLPIIIFSFLAHSIMSLGSSAISFVLLLLVMVTASNFTAIMTGFTVSSVIIPYMDISIPSPVFDNVPLKPLFVLTMPKLIPNEMAITLGIVMGLLLAFKPIMLMKRAVNLLNLLSVNFLKKIFLPLLPIFILGFIFKLEQDKVLSQVLLIYGPILMLVVLSQICYIVFFFLIANDFSLKRAWMTLRNFFPATITGFSTISSAATMPVTIMCAERALNSAIMARTIIPATANIHTLGSALGLTILSMATMRAFFEATPTLFEFFEFAVFYTMAKYAVAGIPGGVVLVVSPLLETYLGFTPEMVGLITAVYLLFDPFGTAANVTCNGAFAVMFARIYRKISKEEDTEERKLQIKV